MLKLEKKVIKSDKKYSSSNDFDGIIDGFFNSMLEKAAGFLFRGIDFDPESLQTLKNYAGKNNVVYVSFHSSNISLLLFCNLLKKHNIDLPIVALEENPYMMQTIKHLGKRIIRMLKKFLFGRKYHHIFETDYIERNLNDKKTILVSLLSRKFFLRRYTEIKYDSLIYLIKLQRSIKEPIYLLPQMIFWNLNPERTRSVMASQATGDKGLILGLFATLKSATPAFVRILPPIDIQKEIQNIKSKDPEIVAIGLRNKLLEMFHHEKRAAIGPIIRSKQEMMEKVLYHKEVLDMIEKQAKRENVSERQLRRKAFKYYSEIAAVYSVVVISLFKIVLTFILNKIFDGIQFDPESIKKIREASKKGPLVLVPSHRSSIDYFIISYIFFTNKLFCPHIAAGRNLFFFPAGFVLRHSGAFSIRRSFIGLDKIYPTIFKQYVRTLVSDGYSIEVFPEGTRTRTGKMRLPKLGFLYYLIEAVYNGYNDDLVFIPIAIDYDRILEEKSYLKELKGKKKKDESIASVIQSRKFLRRKYGRLYITFNNPFTLKDLAAGETDIKKLPDLVANTILTKIGEVTVVTPFALTTTAILMQSAKGFSKNVLRNNSRILFSYLRHIHARLSQTLYENPDIDAIIDYVMESYHSDKIIHQIKIEKGNKEEIVEDLYSLRDDERNRISYYKNCIVHYFIPISFTSLSILYLLKDTDKEIKEAEVKSEYEFIKNIFRREFLYRDDNDTSDRIHEEVYKYYSERSALSRKDGKLSINKNSIGDLKLFSSVMKDQFESYYIVLNTISTIKTDKIKKEDLVTAIRKNALRMFHLGDVDLSESLSLPNYMNAISRFSDEGILRGGSRESSNIDITIADIEKAKVYSNKIEDYLKIIR